LYGADRAPRAYWKGYLKLSLVSCPVALFPASSEREKISFNQINKKTGNRIRYRKVDAETEEEVDSSDIIKGYEVGKGQYIEIQPEELEAIAIESKRTIEIDEFVPKKEIDELYLNSPYYLAPDGEVGQQAFAVIREAIRKEGMVALGRVVFTSREHVIALEPRGKGLLGVTLRYPYEVRKEDEYFDDIPDEKIPKDMLELASHIVETKSGHFEPDKFEDQYEDALKELLKKKQAGEKIEAPKERAPAKVINLMDALRRSVEAERGGSLPRRPPPAHQFLLLGRAPTQIPLPVSPPSYVIRRSMAAGLRLFLDLIHRIFGASSVVAHQMSYLQRKPPHDGRGLATSCVAGSLRST
jgi:DNA end-binding protein Ku